MTNPTIPKTMHRITIALLLVLLAMPAHSRDHEEQPYAQALFGTKGLATIDLQMPDTTWQSILSHARDKQYHLCHVTINGQRIDSVALRTKGASSLDDVTTMQSDRYSFTLKLNHYRKGQRYHGLSRLMLNNNIWDATQVKDAIVYDMAHYLGLPAPLCQFARITVNGRLYGHYLLVEPVEKDFCRRNYPDERSHIYKPYHNLGYQGDDPSAYRTIADEVKVGGTTTSLRNIIAALRSVHKQTDIEQHVDVERIMQYMALQTIAVNFDCMTGHNCQNYFLRESQGRISIIPWDYNLAWGAYPDEDFSHDDAGWPEDFDPSQWKDMDPSQWQDMDPGRGANLFQFREDLGESTPEEVSKIVNFPIDAPFTERLDQRSFFMNLLAIPQYKALYYQYLHRLCVDYIQGGQLDRTLRRLHRQIGKRAGTEANAFYTNRQHREGVQTLRRLLQLKAQSVLGQMQGTIPSTWEGQQAQPHTLIDCQGVNLRKTGNLGYE